MPRKRKEINLNHIAKKCGVSIATVSRVLNDKEGVNEKTRNRVLEFLQEYNISAKKKSPGFRKNIAILSARRSDNGTGGPNLGYDMAVEGIESILHEKGYSIILSKLTEKKALPDIIRNGGAAGVIIMGNDVPDSIIFSLSTQDTPFVSIERESDPSKYFTVTTDNLDGIQKSVNYLVKLGHKKIAYFSGNLKYKRYEERFDFFKNVIQKNGLKVNKKFLKVHLDETDEEEFGSTAAEEILFENTLPGAIITSSDMIAKGTIQALRKNNVRIPEDISVMGFDDGIIIKYSEMKISTVRPDWINKGRIAAAILLQLIDGINIQPYRCVVNTNLVIKDTCTKYSKSIISRNMARPLVYWTEGGKLYEHEKNVIHSWNKNYPKSIITFNPTPEGMETEKIIKSSIIQGISPDMIQGVEIFFANNLAAHDVLVPLDTLDGFSSLIKERKMGNFLNQLSAPDGHIYVLPQHWTPILGVYNRSLLEKAGFNDPPRTYSEFNRFAENLKKMEDMTPTDFSLYKKWWVAARYWHVFLMAALGEKGINSDITRIDTLETRAFLKFISNAVKRKYVPDGEGKYDFVKEENIGYKLEGSPDKFSDMAERNPHLRYAFSPPPVPDFIDINTSPWLEASIKGAVIFKTCKKIEDAWQFLKWHYSTPENDLDLLIITSHIPCRGDLTDNTLFHDYFKKHPDMQEFVNFIGKSNTITHPEKIAIFSIINEKLWTPLLYHQGDIETLIKETEKELEALAQSAE
ncbi:MAG: extracellular solute-binding protein [Spirochaetales bacterium]|nr:extracellular solute-binding protein [Spirochaetales bacterium]